jgi:ABC-2 type transport system ATP-binding protein
VLSALHLSRRFGARLVVDDVTLDVAGGEIVALLGPNGAGKTTTMRMLAGLIAPTTGSVGIAGTPLTRTTATGIRRRLGFLTEAPGLWDRLTVRENLRVYAGIYALQNPDRVIDRWLARFGLDRAASTRAAELSKGMRQKVALARALLHDPTMLLLDEPTSGLDPEVARSVRDLLVERRAAGCAILVSTHNLAEAERLADRVAVLQTRLLALDAPAALRRRLPTSRVVVRLAGDAAPHLHVLRPFDAEAEADGATLTLSLAQIDRDVPEAVRALVADGARITEVRAETPDLESVYLSLVADRPSVAEPPR